MKHRFETQTRRSFLWTVLWSLVLFGVLCGLFQAAVSRLSQRTDDTERTLLDQALTRSIAHCYAIEGRYPESLDYLKTRYGLTYNTERFYVDYQPLGSDLWPDVTILEKEGAKP
jgi:hypothetical protein